MKLSNEAYTPSYFIDPIREFANGFDFDPFSCVDANKIVKAKHFYTIADNAFDSCWNYSGYRTIKVWVNPPYSTKELKLAIAKVIEFKEGKEIYLLLNTDNSTEAYKLCLQHCTALMLVHKRIQFIRPYSKSRTSHNPKTGVIQNNRAQTLFFFGSSERAVEFKHQLASLGKVFIND